MIYQDLIVSINESLAVPGTHVVILGPTGSGKTHLLNDILPRSAIIDRRSDALAAATSPIDARAMDHWVVRTHAAFGIDEPVAILDTLADLLALAHQLQRSYVLCLQSFHALPKEILNDIFLRDECAVRIIELEPKRQRYANVLRELSVNKALEMYTKTRSPN